MNRLKNRLIIYPVSAALFFGALTAEREHVLGQKDNLDASLVEHVQAEQAAEIPEPLAEIGIAIAALGTVALLDGGILLARSFNKDAGW